MGYCCAVNPDLQRLLADNITDNLSDKPMERVRSLRQQAAKAEGDISFVRRIVQGRLDIVGHERKRRQDGSVSSGDVSGLLFDMPDILNDGITASGSGVSRYLEILEPGSIALALIAELDKVVSPAQLSAVDELVDSELGDLFEELNDFELALSKNRRKLHSLIDQVQAEIARRYASGEESVETILRAQSEAKRDDDL